LCQRINETVPKIIKTEEIVPEKFRAVKIRQEWFLALCSIASLNY